MLGLLAIVVPLIANVYVTIVLGWLFLVSGAIGLATTYWARQAPGFWWSLVSALLAIFVGAVLIANKSQDLYGNLMEWPFEDASPLQLILILFFLIEGGASVMFGIEHRRQFSGRWAWIFASGIIDIVLASIVLASIITFNLQGNLSLDDGSPSRDQHDPRGLRLNCDGIACSPSVGWLKNNPTSLGLRPYPYLDPNCVLDQDLTIQAVNGPSRISTRSCGLLATC